MNRWTFQSNSPEQTVALGQAMGRHSKPGHIICITGSLGSGKTILTRGIVEGIRGDARGVRSPTFTLVNEYPGPLPVRHVDLYRLDSFDEIQDLGLGEILGDESGVVIIEWADKLGSLTPEERLDLRIEVKNPESRKIQLHAIGKGHTLLLGAVRGDLQTP